MPKDPAEIARERREHIEFLLTEAERCEGQPGVDNSLLLANNCRLQALCLHAGLRVHDTPEEDDVEPS